MTAITTTPGAVNRPTANVHDTRAFSRKALALLLPVGAALIAVLRFVLPYDTTDSKRDMVDKVAAHTGTQSAVVFLGVIAVLVIIPAYLAAARLVRRHSPRLATAAVALAIPGYVGLAMLLFEDVFLLQAAKTHVDPATAATLLEKMDGSPAAAIAGFTFVVGHILGTVLLGIALYRARLIPRWAAVALAVSQPIHLIAAVVIVSHPLDLVGWGLTAVGFAAVAVRIWNLGNDEWDLPPLSA